MIIKIHASKLYPVSDEVYEALSEPITTLMHTCIVIVNPACWGGGGNALKLQQEIIFNVEIYIPDSIVK